MSDQQSWIQPRSSPRPLLAGALSSKIHHLYDAEVSKEIIISSQEKNSFNNSVLVPIQDPPT